MSELEKLKKEWDLLKHKVGYIAADFYEQGTRILIMRGPASWCAYIGIPLDHPLANYEYDDIPLQCHGGLTYAGEGGGGWPKGWFWYGWDYGHSGDMFGFADSKTREITSQFDHSKDKMWTADEVKEEARQVAWDFAMLKKLAERIKNDH